MGMSMLRDLLDDWFKFDHPNKPFLCEINSNFMPDTNDSLQFNDTLNALLQLELIINTLLMETT